MKNQKLETEPTVYKSVRAVGTLRPKFQPNQGKVFADQLEVRGTAFWLKGYNILVTCAHVIQDLLASPIEISGLLVVGNLGNYLPAKVGFVDFNHDLAVLYLPPDTPQAVIDNESKDGLEIAEEYPMVGTQVAYVGFPLGLQLLNSTHSPTYAEGVIGAKLRNHPTKKEIQITGVVTVGFSGSPIVSKAENNKLIGVLANSPSREAGGASIFMTTSWEHVKALAELTKS